MRIYNKKNPVATTLKALQKIPGVGVSLSQDLADLGYQEIQNLKGENPEYMYQSLMDLRGSILTGVCNKFLGAQFIMLVILSMKQNY